MPTPIGNLKDITLRALEVLKSVDAICCEDTRHSLILLRHYEIRKPLISFHKFNTEKTLPELVFRLNAGENLALISDAGMPCISDPGYELVQAAIREEIPYTVLPGPTALVNALVLSGMSAGSFAFAGFLPEKTRERREILEEFRYLNCPVIFYVSPHGIAEDIDFVRSVYGNRRIAIVKELTKINERVEFSTLEEGLMSPARGEYILLVEGEKRRSNLNELTAEEHLAYYLQCGMSQKDAVKQVAADRGVAKNEIYQLTVKK